ncbi:MAG: hypothetical protein KKD33_05460 [Verrucomicrobia bacterium]|nr:hypothetical protein [Verrucomicrobiota bacterium]
MLEFAGVQDLACRKKEPGGHACEIGDSRTTESHFKRVDQMSLNDMFEMSINSRFQPIFETEHELHGGERFEAIMVDRRSEDNRFCQPAVFV